MSGFVAQCLALGYDKDLALRAAEAMADNDAAAIMACQQEFLDAKQKELEAAALNKQPTLTTGSPPTAQGADVEAINKQRRYFGLPPFLMQNPVKLHPSGFSPTGSMSAS